MRVSVDHLSPGCLHLRLFDKPGVKYLAHTILEPDQQGGCWILGFDVHLTVAIFKAILREAKIAGFKHVRYVRYKNGVPVDKFFNLEDK